MTSQFIGSAYLTIVALLLLVLAQVGQKSLCINSQTIEKITMTDNSTVFRCSSKKRVPYSAMYIQNQRILETKIISFESWLMQIWNLKVPRISLILVDQPRVTQVHEKNIFIWDQNLKLTQQLEIEISKNFLRVMNPEFFNKNQLALDSMADFVVRIWSLNKTLSYGGISSYVGHQWWTAFSGLTVQDKFFLLRNMPTLLKQGSIQSFNDPETSSYDQLNQLMHLFSKEVLFFSRLNLQNIFENSSLTASFDYLILMTQIRSGLLNTLSSFQKKQTSLSLGLWDGITLFHIGSKSQVPAKSFKKLKVSNLIWESCDDLDLQSLLSIPANVRKILVVRNCSFQNQINYNHYIKSGIAGFAAAYPQVSFVQIDIPSLNMRRDMVVLQQKIFDLMSQQAMNKNSKNSFFALFGLERLHWDDKLQIYIPKAHIDAIESFRIFKIN